MTQSDEENSQHTRAIEIEHLQDLIRPVRELSAVWDIPLRDYLDSFIANISGVDLSQQEFRPDLLNFSQAGLFLQGSTNIYAKKVKHLYDLATATIPFEEGAEGEEGRTKSKRRKKIIDYVFEDKLIEIEDPEVIDPAKIRLITDKPRIEVTTMPKIPYCLLNSLDSTSNTALSSKNNVPESSDINNHRNNNQTSYRITTVPNEYMPVILLDPTIDITLMAPMTPVEKTVRIEMIPLNENRAVFGKGPEEEEDHSLPPPQTLPPPIGEKNEEEMKNEEEDKNDDTFQNIPPPPALPSDDEGFDADIKNPFALLDPNSQTLKYMNRQFKPITNFNVPKSLSDEGKTPKKSRSRSAFHNGIFDELFNQVHEYRKEMKVATKIEALSEIPEADGREQILNDMDFYEDDFLSLPSVDLPDESEDVDPKVNPMLTPQILSSKATLYFDSCKAMLMRMIKSGEEYGKTKESEALTKWEILVTPRLNFEMQKKAFKIEEVEQWIIERIRANGDFITFNQLKADVQIHEISRVFLSTLILANKGIIKIEENARFNDNFKIKYIGSNIEI